MWMKHLHDASWHFTEAGTATQFSCGLSLPPHNERMTTTETLFQSMCFECWKASKRSEAGEIQRLQQMPGRIVPSRTQQPSQRSANLPASSPKTFSPKVKSAKPLSSQKQKKPVLPSIKSSPQQNGEALHFASFIAAMLNLGKVGKQCQDILEAKSNDYRNKVSGCVTTSQEEVAKWAALCERTLKTQQHDKAGWRPVIAQLSRSAKPCTFDTMAEHIAVAREAFTAYKREELAEAALVLSALLESGLNLSFDQAFRALPSNEAKSIARAVARKEWTEEYLTLTARNILQRQKRMLVNSSQQVSQEGKEKEVKHKDARESAIKAQRAKTRAALEEYNARVEEEQARKERLAFRNSDSGVVGNPTPNRW